MKLEKDEEMLKESNETEHNDDLLVGTLRIEPRLEMHRTACGHVVFDMDSMEPVATLNETAALVFGLIRERLAPADIARRVAEELEADLGMVEKHVAALVGQLLDQGMLNYDHDDAAGSDMVER